MDPVWDEFRRRRRAFWLAILLGLLWSVPGSLTCSFLVRYGLDYDLAFLLVVVLPAMGNITVAHLSWMFCPCPHCGQSFHCSWFYGNPYARHCVHCGLPKWAPGTGEKKGSRKWDSPEWH